MRTELVDVNNGEAFTLADFAGTPVLLESFAPWCPVCISQQLQIEGLHDTPPSIVSVSLDADPYEPWGPVVRHSSLHGFTDYDHWHYAILRVVLTGTSLIDFSPVIASAPSAPVILICAD